MPKIVDHDKRRDEIALVACGVVAEYGFEKASMVRIARGAGYTTGMLAHYFDSKQEIIIAALRLILRRIDERLAQPAAAGGRPDLLALLTEALPVDEHRRTECAFWTTFWGQVSTDKRLKRINSWVHREYLRLFERCLAQCWLEWSQWPPATREQVLRSLVTFINGLTAGAVANAGDWPAARQIEQLRLQLKLLRAWAMGTAGAPPLSRKAAGA
jgi:TetR/AcrR family transcriptional repressor of bet genes